MYTTWVCQCICGNTSIVSKTLREAEKCYSTSMVCVICNVYHGCNTCWLNVATMYGCTWSCVESPRIQLDDHRHTLVSHIYYNVSGNTIRWVSGHRFYITHYFYYHNYSYITAICFPVQMIIIPLECNSSIKLRRDITLPVNLWLLIHFQYLNIKYSHCNTVALCYRLCCTVWMIVYCYPDQTYNTYHWFKQWRPNWG